jgi:hypothetical protein
LGEIDDLRGLVKPECEEQVERRKATDGEPGITLGQESGAGKTGKAVVVVKVPE